MIEALAVLGGYVLGSLPFGYWLPRVLRGEDIRTRGSGNVGATNVFRVYGKRLGIAVALLDVAKGFTAALLGVLAGGALVGGLAGAAAMIGHARPVFLRFARGGKMVATPGGAFLGLAPPTATTSAASPAVLSTGSSCVGLGGRRPKYQSSASETASSSVDARPSARLRSNSGPASSRIRRSTAFRWRRQPPSGAPACSFSIAPQRR